MGMPTEAELEAAFNTIAPFHDAIEELLRRTPSKSPLFLNALSRTLGAAVQITSELDYGNGKRNILLLAGKRAIALQFYADGTFSYTASNILQDCVEQSSNK